MKKGAQIGNKNNPNGRPKGTPNKVTQDIKERIRDFIDANFEDAVKAFKRLDDKDKVLMYEKLMKYAVPTMSATTVTGQISIEEIKMIISGKMPFGGVAISDIQQTQIDVQSESNSPHKLPQGS